MKSPALSRLIVVCHVGLAWLFLVLPVPAAMAAAEPDPSMPQFDIYEYDVEGNTRLSDSQIEKAVTPFLGEDKTLRDVEGARAALEAAYRDAGYLTAVVSIPEQKVDDGNVILNVIEGKVDRLRVKGAEYHLASGIKAQIPELAEGKVPYFPEVQRQLEMLNRSADLKATPVLKAGRTPGTVEVGLDVDDQLPLHGNLEVNNRSTPGTRAIRIAGMVRYDNLWQLGHSLSVSGQTAPEAPEQMKMLAATYVMPLNGGSDTLAVYGVHSSSNVPGETAVLNNSDIVGLRLGLPLPTADNYSHALSVGLDYKSIRPVQGLLGDSLATELQPAIRYVPVVASYSGAWVGSTSTTGLDATATMGLRGLFGNQDSSFDAKRPGASAQYFVLRTGLSQTASFGRWSASGRAEIQSASGLLLPNEQYAAGGAENVRGYQESEQTGDRAYRISLEVRTPTVQLGSATTPLRMTGLAFFDMARLTSLQYDPLYSRNLSSLHYTLRGVGVGVRLSGPKGLSLDFDLAGALNDAGNASTSTKAGDYRLHSRLIWEFL
jgi:hemolysin activation/secretion protein